jgi:hypothetical protein
VKRVSCIILLYPRPDGLLHFVRLYLFGIGGGVVWLIPQGDSGVLGRGEVVEG